MSLQLPWRVGLLGAVIIVTCITSLAAAEFPGATDHVTVLTGPVEMWANENDYYVLVTDEQAEPKEHLFVLQRGRSDLAIKKDYSRARVTFRPTRLEVSDLGSEESWVLRLVPVEMLSIIPRQPAGSEAGLIVGYGLSHHEQPVETNAAALEVRALDGMFLQKSEDPGTPGSCNSGGYGSSSCSIGCGGGRNCSVTCTLGYACCKCLGDSEPSCTCNT